MRRPAFAVLFLSLLFCRGAAFAQEWSRPGGSEWWPEIRKVEAELRAHKWKAALKKARTLADRVSRSSWYGPDLGRVLAELALAEAVADANLGHDRQAIWLWHTAINLDFKIRRRDLSPYGEAAKLLYENKLRRQGEMPPGFDDREVTPLVRSERPKPPEMKRIPTIVSNSAAVREGSADCHVEVIVDEKGALHHPVVVSSHLHPIVIYGVLRWLEGLPPFEPRRIEGEATDSLYDLVVDFQVSRW